MVKNSEHEIKYYQDPSSEMYGGIDEQVLNEDSKFIPKSPYAVGKVFAHEITRTYRESYGTFAVNGILFNHESPLRGETFVTRKITKSCWSHLSKIAIQAYTGNLSAARDWGFSGDYVRGMYLMMQHSDPEDWVLATGEAHTVKDFAEEAFSAVGLNWEDFVVTSEKYERPNEVKHLGDSTKAQNKLGCALN